MDMESGSYPLDMQTKKVVNNLTSYNGSHPCPQCGVVMNPVAAMYGKGMCPQCFAQQSAKRLKDRMA